MKKINLDWDSKFFGLKVERLEVNLDDDLPAGIAASLHDSSADLVYVFSNRELPADLVNEFDMIKYDDKIIYEKKLEGKTGKATLFVQEFRADISHELENLAYVSGIHSRFNLDPGLNRFYRPMYREWLDNACNTPESTVFTSYADDAGIPHLSGMITISLAQRKSVVGLLAVDEKYRGRGFGSALLQAGERWSIEHGAEYCEVGTQLANKQACRLYEKNRFISQTVIPVYHFWKNHK